jgi:hypothetical protein
MALLHILKAMKAKALSNITAGPPSISVAFFNVLQLYLHLVRDSHRLTMSPQPRQSAILTTRSRKPKITQHLRHIHERAPDRHLLWLGKVWTTLAKLAGIYVPLRKMKETHPYYSPYPT